MRAIRLPSVVSQAGPLLVLAAFPLAFGLGCNCGGAPEGVVDTCESELTLPPSVSTDILFVIDNSGSMAEEQQKVVDQLHTFVSSLVSGPVKNDFQIGVVTTGVSVHWMLDCPEKAPLADTITYPDESGRLQRGKDAQGRDVPSSPRLLSSANREAEGDAWLEKVKQLVTQRTSGSGQEMGLEAMRRALSEPLITSALDANPSGNAGFLRPGSRLLVVILSDEDDCSVPTVDAITLLPSHCGTECSSDSQCAPNVYCVPESPGVAASKRRCLVNACETPEGREKLVPVQEYIDFLKNLDDGTGTGRKREVFLAVIGAVDAEGTPQRCRTATDEAYGVAERYKQIAAAMGSNGLVDSICNADYGTTLQGIAQMVSAPQTLELAKSPPDGHLLLIDLEREGGTETCRMGDGFDFEPARDGMPARVTLRDRCRLRNGDRLALKVACAG